MDGIWVKDPCCAKTVACALLWPGSYRYQNAQGMPKRANVLRVDPRQASGPEIAVEVRAIPLG